jgi:2-oxoglutarate ferredoxin oxidoreductase subunit alpha
MRTRSVNIVIGGEAGQGLKTIERIIANICKHAGFHVYSTREYESRIRGGVNTTSLVVSSPEDPVGVNLRDIDLFVSLTDEAVRHVEDRLTDDSIVIGENADAAARGKSHAMSAEEMAKEIGGEKFASMIASGIIGELLGITEDEADRGIRSGFAKAGEEIIGKNIEAYKRGKAEAEEIRRRFGFRATLERSEEAAGHMYLAGSDTVAAGALAAGCTFVTAYPMSPGTAVLTALGSRAREFGIVVEQAEDEIAAANMVVGAWYAGARAMTTTSGGGFALMSEALSLAGMLETPMVIHIAQRPGPATGLPTRSSQGDLSFAVYGGHGYFPRAVFAPGTIEEGYRITAHAFQAADAYQVPVLLLTDQDYMDSHDTIPEIDIEEARYESFVVRSGPDYQRYAFTEEGLSPRSVPGYGEGVVKVDSDEHDEAGHITESMEMRRRQVEKRRRKEMFLRRDSLPPRVNGGEQGTIAVIGWGSTEPIIAEALRRVDDPRLVHVHFSQVYPLAEETAEILGRYERRILVEDSPRGAFAELLRSESGVLPEEKILKDDGIPFYAEELTESLKELLE